MIKLSEIKCDYQGAKVKRGQVKNSFIIEYPNKTIIKHYDSEIVTIEGNKTTLYNADYGVTTKKIVNSFLPSGDIKLVTRDFKPFISLNGILYPYHDFMFILFDNDTITLHKKEVI